MPQTQKRRAPREDGKRAANAISAMTAALVELDRVVMLSRAAGGCCYVELARRAEVLRHDHGYPMSCNSNVT